MGLFKSFMSSMAAFFWGPGHKPCSHNTGLQPGVSHPEKQFSEAYAGLDIILVEIFRIDKVAAGLRIPVALSGILFME